MKRNLVFFVALGAVLIGSTMAEAGPPYATDDPEPVEPGHFELYLASTTSRTSGGWSGAAPLVDANYGALPDLHLHVLLQGAYSAPKADASRYGLGDIELGAKLRFIHETKWMPQVATYPAVEIPTGSEKKGLGNGHPQIFVPVWLQKSFGSWTSFGGFGYWINSGAGRRNSWFAGGVLQRRFTSAVSAGAEIFHTTSQSGPEEETRFNIGLVLDLSPLHHLLFSAGRGIQGPNRFQSYLGYQLTFGPEEEPPEPPAGSPPVSPPESPAGTVTP